MRIFLYNDRFHELTVLENKEALADFCYSETPDDIGAKMHKPHSKMTVSDWLDTLPYCEYRRLSAAEVKAMGYRKGEDF